jgi:hypothetical protein
VSRGFSSWIGGSNLDVRATEPVKRFNFIGNAENFGDFRGVPNPTHWLKQSTWNQNSALRSLGVCEILLTSDGGIEAAVD